ncbi:hypothetical protein Ancab_035957, partial [Ancistrocladus abbreviatus]
SITDKALAEQLFSIDSCAGNLAFCPNLSLGLLVTSLLHPAMESPNDLFSLSSSPPMVLRIRGSSSLQGLFEITGVCL